MNFQSLTLGNNDGNLERAGRSPRVSNWRVGGGWVGGWILASKEIHTSFLLGVGPRMTWVGWNWQAESLTAPSETLASTSLQLWALTASSVAARSDANQNDDDMASLWGRGGSLSLGLLGSWGTTAAGRPCQSHPLAGRTLPRLLLGPRAHRHHDYLFGLEVAQPQQGLWAAELPDSLSIRSKRREGDLLVGEALQAKEQAYAIFEIATEPNGLACVTVFQQSDFKIRQLLIYLGL